MGRVDKERRVRRGIDLLLAVYVCCRMHDVVRVFGVCVCRITEAWLTQLWQYLGGADTLAGVAASGWPILPCVSAIDSGSGLSLSDRWLVPMRTPSGMLVPGGFPPSAMAVLFQVT